ncbi:MAG: 2-hydroxyacid dehydrogenase [Pseudomonadota bacterium]|nr:2-hydroxyacid dehydrogenase [Pseudomonadota bacterium]
MDPMVLLAGHVSRGREGLLKQWLTTGWRIESCDPARDMAAFERLAPEATAIVGGPLRRPWPALPKLKLYQIPYTGHDFIAPDHLPVTAVLCNTYEHETAIAEYILLAMLEWQIRLARIDADFRVNGWSSRSPAEGPVHGEVLGKTVGIVGYGHIGHEVAVRAKAFGMTVTGVGRRERAAAPAPLDRYETVGAGLDRLMAESDYVLVCCPLSEETRGLIDARRLALMKPSAVLINVARGLVVEEEALYRALVDKRIGGAVIDVWYNYPTVEDRNPSPMNFPFRDLENTILSPHNSGWTQEQIDRRWRFVCANLDRLARGEALQNIVYRGTAPA